MEPATHFMCQGLEHHPMAVDERKASESITHDEDAIVRFSAHRDVMHAAFVLDLQPCGGEVMAKCLLNAVKSAHASRCSLPFEERGGLDSGIRPAADPS